MSVSARAVICGWSALDSFEKVGAGVHCTGKAWNKASA